MEMSGKGRDKSGMASWSVIINGFGPDFDAKSVEDGVNIRPELCPQKDNYHHTKDQLGGANFRVS